MNTVLGVFVLILKGQIISSAAIGAYPSIEACRAEMHKQAEAINVEEPKKLGVLCVQLDDDIDHMYGKVKT